MTEYRRILILSPEPYRTNSTSRCLYSFFGGWDKEKIAQVYTTDILPTYLLCDHYYRMTDRDMAGSIFGKRKYTIFRAASDKVNTDTSGTDHRSNFTRVIKKYLNKKNSFYYLLRMALWSKRKWNTGVFEAWVENFNPEVIFLDLGADNILTDIALEISKNRRVPIITFIPDDYYIKLEDKNYLFDIIYKKKYKGRTKTVINESYSIIFACELMEKAYQKEFHCGGEVLYFTSDIKPDPLVPRKENTFAYLGAFEFGRWKSLVTFANALHAVSNELYLDVYGKTANEEQLLAFSDCSGIRYHGFVPYSEVVEVMNSFSYILHVEDFSKENKKWTRYSLSTKIADCLTCGACTIAFGPEDVGSIDYLKSTKSAYVITDEKELGSALRKLINNDLLRTEIVENARAAAYKNHSVLNNQARMKAIAENACSDTRNAT